MPRSFRPLVKVLALVALASGLAALADDYKTPRAGEVAVGTIFGKEVRAPKRDRTLACAWPRAGLRVTSAETSSPFVAPPSSPWATE